MHYKKTDKAADKPSMSRKDDMKKDKAILKKVEGKKKMGDKKKAPFPFAFGKKGK